MSEPHAGADLRIRIHARDVALATERPHGLSIRNVLPARILRIDLDDTINAEVLLDVDGQHLRSRITRDAVEDLKLAPDQHVFALIKSRRAREHVVVLRLARELHDERHESRSGHVRRHGPRNVPPFLDRLRPARNRRPPRAACSRCKTARPSCCAARTTRRCRPHSSPGSTLRETTFGVRSAADLERIAAELAKDRARAAWIATARSTRSTRSGSRIAFRVARRTPVAAPELKFNTPGHPDRINTRGQFFKRRAAARDDARGVHDRRARTRSCRSTSTASASS